MEVASLGFEIDSKSVKVANDELGRLPRSASAAERAAERWGLTASRMARQVANDNTLAVQSYAVLGNTLKTVIAIAGGLVGGLVTAFGLSSFIAQTDIVSDSLKELGKTWSGLFNVGPAASVPLALAIDALAYALDNPVFAGFVHTIGELLFGAMTLALKGATLLVEGFTWLLQQLDTFQVALGTAGALLIAVFGPAILSAIAAGFGVMAGAAIAAINGITAALAANPFGALYLAIVATITLLYVFRDEIEKIFGVDVIGIVKRAANYVIGSFVAAYNDIKFLWANFPDVIGAAVIGAVNLVAKGINATIQTAAGAIDWLIEKANKIPGVNIGKIGEIAPAQLQDNPYADRLGRAAADRGRQQQEELNRDYLGQLGDALKLSAPGPKKFDTAMPDEKAGRAARAAKEEVDKAAEAYAKLLGYGQDFIAMQEAERAGIGLSAEAAARLRYEQDLLNRARKAGIDLSPQQVGELQALAASMAAAEERTRALKEAYDFAKGTFVGFLQDFRRGLQQGQSVWEAFGNAGLNALNKISDKLFEMAANKLFESAFGGSGGSGGLLGGLLGGLFGGGGGGITAAGGGFDVGAAAALPGGFMPGFAAGGIPPVGSPYMVGEHGPEVRVDRRPGQIFNRQQWSRLNGGSGQVIVTVTGDTDLVRVTARDEAGKAVAVAAPGIVKESVKKSGDRVPAVMAQNEAQRGGEWRA